MKRRTVVVATGTAALAGCLSERGGQGAERLDARGELAIVVDGEPVDLTADRFQSEHAANESADFHLHDGSEEWFMEGTEPVTVAAAIDLLPHFAFERRGDDVTVTIDGRTYDAGEPETSIVARVDGETVDPTAYELADGDRLRLEISTGAGAS